MVERCIYIYILLLHRKQLHVSALDNGHLQVVHESLSKQLYKCIYIYIYIYMGYLYGRMVGTCVMHERLTIRHKMMPTIDLSVISLDNIA